MSCSQPLFPLGSCLLMNHQGQPPNHNVIMLESLGQRREKKKSMNQQLDRLLGTHPTHSLLREAACERGYCSSTQHPAHREEEPRAPATKGGPRLGNRASGTRCLSRRPGGLSQPPGAGEPGDGLGTSPPLEGVSWTGSGSRDLWGVGRNSGQGEGEHEGTWQLKARVVSKSLFTGVA